MESVLRAVAIFFILLVLLRLSGRRTMSDATPFDFALLLIVAETTQQALLADDRSMTNALVVMVVLFTLDVGLSFVKQFAPVFDRLLDGVPTILVAHGKPEVASMRKARVGIEDVLAAARQTQGLERLDQIRFAILEGDGKLSIIPR